MTQLLIDDTNRRFQLAVIGGGIAGLTSALRAQELGVEVVLLERGKDQQYPCNSRFSGGIFHIAFNDVKKSADELLQAIDAETGGDFDEDQAKSIISTAPRLVDWLQDQGARFIRFGPLSWHRWCLAPARPVSPGLDWNGRGPDVTLRRMSELFIAKGGTLKLDRVADRFHLENGEIRGVYATNEGKQELWQAPNVLIADGGFQSNKAFFVHLIQKIFRWSDFGVNQVVEHLDHFHNGIRNLTVGRAANLNKVPLIIILFLVFS